MTNDISFLCYCSLQPHWNYSDLRVPVNVLTAMKLSVVTVLFLFEAIRTVRAGSKYAASSNTISTDNNEFNTEEPGFRLMKQTKTKKIKKTKSETSSKNEL